jgi:hypothetical protein
MIDISRNRLGRSGFLLDALVCPTISDPERALFIGKYGLEHFDDIESFCDFTCRISAATQEWYESRDLDLAIASLTEHDEWSSWLPQANKAHGELWDLLAQLGVDVHEEQIPKPMNGELHWIGDRYNLSLVARCAGFWADAFVADRVW